jgi:hypothetical protein
VIGRVALLDRLGPHVENLVVWVWRSGPCVGGHVRLNGSVSWREQSDDGELEVAEVCGRRSI